MDEAFRGSRGPGNYSSGSIADGLFQGDGGGGRSKKQSSSRRVADRFVLSHVVLAGVGDPPMYTAGLRFYQVRDTAYRLHGVGAVASEDYDGAPAESDGDDGNRSSGRLADGEKSRYYQLTVYKDSGEISKSFPISSYRRQRP